MVHIDGYDLPTRDVSLIVYRPRSLIGALERQITVHPSRGLESNRTARVRLNPHLEIETEHYVPKTECLDGPMRLEEAVAVSIQSYDSCCVKGSDMQCSVQLSQPEFHFFASA